jgi:hypothetical protein
VNRTDVDGLAGAKTLLAGTGRDMPGLAEVADRPNLDRAGRTVAAPIRLLDERKQRSRRASFLKWLRKLHGWIGLWGAVLGLLFGVTGFLLNHRAGPMKISTGAPQVSRLRVPLPTPGPASPRELADYVKRELKLDGRIGRLQQEPAHKVVWGDRTVMQPEHWSATIVGPSRGAALDYWVGNAEVEVKRTEHTALAMLTNLHKGTGMGVGWVLLGDTIAGSLLLLSLTGVLLWTELTKKKTVGALIFAVSLVAMIWTALS